MIGSQGPGLVARIVRIGNPGGGGGSGSGASGSGSGGGGSGADGPSVGADSSLLLESSWEAQVYSFSLCVITMNFIIKIRGSFSINPQ